MAGSRASIFEDDEVDVASFAPKPKAALGGPPKAEVRAVAEAANFRSREGVAVAPRLAQRRHRTGRNAQINIKATRETIDAFLALSDRQGWVLGETLEHALQALERTLSGDGKSRP
jgi:hypothetical protein